MPALSELSRLTMHKDYERRIERVRAALEDAEHVIIGAGAGLSAAAGLTYSGERFLQNFEAYRRKYGMQDMYSAGFYPFATEEEKWGYWAKHIDLNRYTDTGIELYRELEELVRGKNYFVLTTNVDSLMMKAGVDEQHFFEMQGNYGEFQCSVPCSDTVYPNEDSVRAMVAAIDDELRVPTELLPRCPSCGASLTQHLRVDSRFVETELWHRQQQAWADFARSTLGTKTVIFELGVGYNTPTLIRYPSERLTYQNPQATLVRLNRDNPQGPAETEPQTVSFTEDMVRVVGDLRDKK